MQVHENTSLELDFFLPGIPVLWEATNLCNSLLVVQPLSFAAMMYQNSKHRFGTLFLKEF